VDKKVSTDLFVYGTLKSGGRNNRLLAEQEFIGVVRTARRYRLYLAGAYPCLVQDEHNGSAVWGELWRVNALTLRVLDELEEVPTLFNRQTIELDNGLHVQAYTYQLDVSRFPDCGEVYLASETSRSFPHD
jgi:gamma-glutamylcyclotransferase (GGCT)/AIG2-like uncharacterized protein YtfP